MPYNCSTDTLGDIVKMFVDYRFTMKVNKDEKDIIESVEGDGHPERLLRNIRKAASRIMFTRRGTRRHAREVSLKKNFDYEIICVEAAENDKNEWLTLGIKTPIGIIVYELL